MVPKNRRRSQHHINDAISRDFVEVCIDYKMMGVTSFDSWGDRPMSEYSKK